MRSKDQNSQIFGKSKMKFRDQAGKGAALLALALLVVGSGFHCSGADVVVNKRANFKKIKRLAIFPISSPRKSASYQIATELTTEFLRAGFDVVDRSQMNRIIRELKLSATGMVDQSKAAEVGKLAGADAVVTGIAKLDRRRGRLIYLNIKMINVETSSVVVSARTRGRQRYSSAASDVAAAIRRSILRLKREQSAKNEPQP